jgi:predicted metal-dependent peptidase
MKSNLSQLNSNLSKIVKELMFAEPFYGIYLLSLNKRWEKVGTACVGRNNVNYDLKIDPDFWNNLVQDHKLGLLKHELLHIAFCHLTDFNFLTDKKVANMAMDIEINQYIDPSWLPEGGCTIDKFPNLNLEPKRGTKYYYDKLLKNQDDEDVQCFLQACAQPGACDGDMIELPNGAKIRIVEHDWDEVTKADEGTQKVLRAQSVQVLNEVAAQAKSRGTIPGEIQTLLDLYNASEPPKFDWKGYIRRFTGKSIKIFTKKSRRKYNKRYIENPGLKIKQKKHILVAIDTSGSVNNDELKEFFQEIHHLYKTGNEVTIAQADTAISHIGPYNPKDKYEIYGRGGTNFNPVVDHFEENRRKYSCLIYFTDGEAPAPENGKKDILWVLSSVSHMNENLPGSVIQLN